MLHLIKATRLGNISCYTRPKTKEGFIFLEEQMKKTDSLHSVQHGINHYYIWDAELKRDACKWEYISYD